MANDKHLMILKKDAKAWNEWRSAHPKIIPDLKRSDLQGMDLRNYNLSRANLRWVILNGANLSHCDLRCSDLSHADLGNADLSNADLSHANLYECDYASAKKLQTKFDNVVFNKYTTLRFGQARTRNIRET